MEFLISQRTSQLKKFCILSNLRKRRDKDDGRRRGIAEVKVNGKDQGKDKSEDKVKDNDNGDVKYLSIDQCIANGLNNGTVEVKGKTKDEGKDDGEN